MTAQRTQLGALSIKVSYSGTPGGNVFYTATDLAGNIITDRTSLGVIESASTPGLYFYDQEITLDQFIATWDENDGLATATEVVATRHTVGRPSKPTSVVATGANTSASIAFTPGDSGGSTIIAYTVTAIDSTNTGRGGQTQADTTSPILITGLTNGDHYTFTVIATNSLGDSPPSSASNSIVPAVVLTVPDPPTNLQATASSGQVVVTFTAPANNGGSAITSYTATAVDESTPANGGQTHVGNSPSTVTALVNGDAYHFTVHATNTIGNSAESLQSNTVTPSGSGGTATFTYTQSTGTMVLLDATGSTGTLTWEVDGVASPTTTTTLLIGPLKVGSHHIKLTAVSGGAGISQRDIDVAWVGRPLGSGQNDNVNGSGVASIGYWGLPPHSHSASELPQWASLPTLSPWRNISILNMVENYPTAGDGVERMHIFDDNHISLTTKTGDHPGTSGGYRSSIEWNHSYMTGKAQWATGTTYVTGFQVRYGTKMYTSLQNANTGHQPDTSPTWWAVYSEFAETHQFDVTGQNVSDAGIIDGHSTLVRFYRISIKIPTGSPAPLYQNNFYQLFGVSDGAVIFTPNGLGTQLQWNARSKINGVGGVSNFFDSANIQQNVWYDYVVEVCFNTDPAVGYVRIYRDYGLGAGMVVLPMSRCPAGTKGKTDGTLPSASNYGKFFYASQQTDNTGTPVKAQIDVQNYRDKNGLDALYNAGTPYPDITAEYKNCIVGPTLASVMI